MLFNLITKIPYKSYLSLLLRSTWKMVQEEQGGDVRAALVQE
jgi:hypothetical protein